MNDTLRVELLGSTYVSCGVRHNQNQLAELYTTMSLSLEDSTTYQWILKKGHDEGLAEGVARQKRARLLNFPG